jgi:hypothetical protein
MLKGSMSSSGTYKRGYDYPNEGFVQRAIEEYFIKLGYNQIKHSYTDLVCIKPNTEDKWVIEAKGLTEDVGLDFKTGLGQIVQRMDSQDAKYAIAVPSIDKFINQCRIIRPWVRKLLQLYWLFVDEDGQISIYSPNDEL